MPVMISRSGRCPWRTRRRRPASVLRSACRCRKSPTSASTACVRRARAPLREISVSESVKVPGCASLKTLVSTMAYHSFGGEVEALNTPTIRRLTPSCRHQLSRIAPYAKRSRAADYAFGWDDKQWQRVLDDIESNWGSPQSLSIGMRTAGTDADPERIAAYFRASASPGAAAAIMRMNRDIDVRHILSATHVPTLVTHRTGDPVIDVEHARYLARNIPGAKLVEFPGQVHTPWLGDRDAILDEVEQFLTGAQHMRERERLLATVLFADIVGSTERVSLIGDDPWRELLNSFFVQVREVLQEYRGREVNTSGDGFLAAFDGPARAI